MKNWAITATTVSALVVTALGMPGAATAAPSGPSSVDDTVASLQAEGYKVIVTRLSGAESPNCSVYAVRPGQQITQETPTGGRGNHARQVVSNTVYVDVRC
jgi:peroxiredoxin